MQPPLQPGSKITVFDRLKNELGEGTLKRREFEAGRDLTVYECEEHVILAKGEHYLKVDGKTYRIKTGLA
jgi:hypothetical protein